MVVTHLELSGMRSVHCARAVYTALGGVEGVLRAEVAVGRATVEHDGHVSCGALAAAVASVGYAITRCIEERGRLPVL